MLKWTRKKRMHGIGMKEMDGYHLGDSAMASVSIFALLHSIIAESSRITLFKYKSDYLHPLLKVLQ